MTHISKQTLQSKVEEKLLDQFAKFFADQDEFKIKDLFSNLLSKPEQIMLIKRLAIVIMVLEKHSVNSIAQTIVVSDSTVRNIKAKISLGYFDFLIKRYENKKFDGKAFLNLLETLLNAGMPSLGKDRWKSLR